MAQDNTQDNTTESKKSFKDTLNLPNTEFPIRPNHKVDDVALVERWEKDNLYYTAFEFNKGKEKYILHDGPPYANGDIHLGHAYNKILKDMVTKSRRMYGYHVPVTPGWDCHGLPIEIKVTQQNPGLNRVELKKACREYANNFIDIQRKSFKSIGVVMDWDRPYITMDFGYESAIVRSFGSLVSQGFIERKNKTVPWCGSCQTVLASAEIEYKDRKDPSIYVLFDLKESDAKRLFPEINNTISLVLWTTTPWSIPLNRAVMAKPNSEYVLLELNNKYIIAGAQVADKLVELLATEKKVIKKFSAQELAGAKAVNPISNHVVPIIFDESVGSTEGTAFVNCAPGCGPIDYEVGVKNDLEIFSPLSSNACYVRDIIPTELENMPVKDGQIWVIKKLVELGKMLFKNNISHSYPHCWRCREGLIFRATPQWFFDLNKEGIKNQALQAISKMNFIPEQGRNFLKATVESRWEWCLSRQRVWGVPIPALLCNTCDYSYLNEELINKVADGVSHEGIEYWDKVEIKDLINSDFKCPNCKTSNFRKEQDILDVWFDAGVSHYAVLYNNFELAFPADIYLEGIDQHRGWFQSSLLTSLVLEKEPCTRTIMTHGYTVDAKGQKMSKSLGNVVSPIDIMNQVGADGLRLWVASVGYDGDPVFSDVLLKNVSEVYRKIRNTCRFLLSNLYDFNFETDAISHDKLLLFDQYALTELADLNRELINAYLKNDFTGISHRLAEYCSGELSAFYLDIVKDRLYVEKPDGHKRRSAQTVLFYILDTITRLMAPVLSFTAELVSDYYQKDKTSSIHLQPFIKAEMLNKLSTQENNNILWDALKNLRSVILKSIELEREKGIIKHSLEAQVELYIDKNKPEYKYLEELSKILEQQNQDLTSFFKEFLIVSQFKYSLTKDNLEPSSVENIYVKVTPAQGNKCPRCWQWDTNDNPDGLCKRCELVLNK